jgi:hypothetical protein
VTVTVACPPTADELITTALHGVDRALRRLDQLTPSPWVHAIRQDLTVVKGTLLTPPVRPQEMPGA